MNQQAQQCSAGLHDDRNTLAVAKELCKASASQTHAMIVCMVALRAEQMQDISYP